MIKHTAGPWRVEPPSKGSKQPIIQGAEWSGEVAVVFGDDGEDNIKANAALIAAAPELLEVLEEVKRIASSNRDILKGAPHYSGLWRIEEIAAAIIAKAKGE